MEKEGNFAQAIYCIINESKDVLRQNQAVY